MKMNIKLSKAQISKKIHSGGVLGSWLGKLGKKVVTDPATPFGKINFAKWIWKKNKWKRSCKSRKMIHFDHFEWRYSWYMEILKSLEDSEVVIDSYWSSETLNKKQERGFLEGYFFSGKRYYWKRSHESRKIIIITWMKMFISAPSFKQYWGY